MKRSVIYHVFFHAVKEISAAVTNVLDHGNETRMETVDRLCVPL